MTEDESALDLVYASEHVSRLDKGKNTTLMYYASDTYEPSAVDCVHNSFWRSYKVYSSL